MSSPQYISLSQFNVKNLIPAAKVMQMKTGAKILPLVYKYPNNSEERLNIVTPDVYLPFGLSSFNTESNRWTCDISFFKKEDNPNLQRLYDVTREIDDFVLTTVYRNFNIWFGKDKSLEVLREQYSPLIRESDPPGKFAPNLRAHANPSPDGRFKFNIYNPQGELLECTANPRETAKIVPKKTKARLLLEFSSIWFSATGFGLSCNVKQIIVIPNNNIISQPIIQDLEYTEEGSITTKIQEVPISQFIET